MKALYHVASVYATMEGHDILWACTQLCKLNRFGEFCECDGTGLVDGDIGDTNCS